MDNLSAIATARDEGKEEGLVEDKHEKALETARKMLADGLSRDMVAKYTGLSEEVISKI